MDFQITPLPATIASDLSALTDAELAARHAHRVVVTEKPGAPCRVSLEDAEVGETVILTNYIHQPANSPYRASHAIYVREGAEERQIPTNTIPDMIQHRLLSLRFFDQDDMIIDAAVLPGDQLQERLASGFDNPDVSYAHIHFAMRGCFAAAAHRAG